MMAYMNHTVITQVGWDTDQFLTDPRESALLMAAVIDNGGLAPGGINFDAKLRRCISLFPGFCKQEITDLC